MLEETQSQNLPSTEASSELQQLSAVNGGTHYPNDAVEVKLEPVTSEKHEIHEEQPTGGSNDAVSNSVGSAVPELKKNEGNKTFTMRELLNGLKGDQGQSPGSASPQRFGFRFRIYPFLSLSMFSNCLI